MLLVILRAGLMFAVWHSATRPTEARRAIIAGLEEELEGSEFERDRLVTELSQANAALKRLRGGTTDSASAFDDPVRSAVAAPATPAPVVFATTPDGRLRQLSDIYHRNHAELLRKTGFEASLVSNRAKRKTILEAPMSFSEQTTTTDIEGNVTGMRGVRTSNADRERAVAERDQTTRRTLSQCRREGENRNGDSVIFTPTQPALSQNSPHPRSSAPWHCGRCGA